MQKVLPLLLLTALLTVYVRQIQSPPVCKDCNVILITVDSMDRSHLGLYGYERSTSPNLDAWSRNALMFDGYVAASGLTPVTQTSLHTGLYPTNHGVVSFSSALPNDVPMLAQRLKEAGYATAAIGSAPEYFASGTTGWQERRQSFQRGFDEFFDEYFDYSIRPHPPRPVSQWQDFRWPEYDRGLPLGAIDWIGKSPDKKFFLWIPIGTVHWPYNDEKPLHFADKNYRGLLKADRLNWRLPSRFRRIYQNKLWPETGDPIPLTGEDTRFIVDRYDDGIYLTDQFLGELFSAITERGLDKNTIVIVTTEHGEEFGTHGYYAHYDVFDDEIRTPFLMKIPGISGGARFGQVSSVDLLPTLTELLHIGKPRITDGKSFVRLIPPSAEHKRFRQYTVTERTPLMETLMYDSSNPKDDWMIPFIFNDQKNHYRDVAVRTKDWKLIYRESREAQQEFGWWRILTGSKGAIPEYELYHLATDPTEQNNVITAFPSQARAMQRALRSWLAATSRGREKLLNAASR